MLKTHCYLPTQDLLRDPELWDLTPLAQASSDSIITRLGERVDNHYTINLFPVLKILGKQCSDTFMSTYGIGEK